MAKLPIRDLNVVRSEQVTPNMQRVTLGGAELHNFPKNHEGAWIALLFPQVGETTVHKPRLLQPKNKRPRRRYYTIRNFNEKTKELTIDMVLHGSLLHTGVASNWARKCRKGDNIVIAGPHLRKANKPTQMIDEDAAWFFLIGDMTALPAVICNIELLPQNAKGYVVIEICNESDKQELQCPQGIEIHWLINPHPSQRNGDLANKVKSLPWLTGTPSIWSACEQSTMYQLRYYFNEDRNINLKENYIVSYWKIGQSKVK